MSEDQGTPSEETVTPGNSGECEALPKATGTENKENGDISKAAPSSPGIAKRIRNLGYSALKKTLLITAITSPIRGTPGNMAIRGMQHTGMIPTFGGADSLETPYRGFADQDFEDNIAASRLPDIPLQPSRINNYVFEPNGEDIPVYLLHGESINAAEAAKRLNTTLYHAQNVASSYHHTLKKLTGREPEIKLIDGAISEGLIFNGPQIDLLRQNKTIVNNSVCFSALDQTDDVSDYKAWIFHAAGNIGSKVAETEFQPQPGGLSYHGPRSVLVGSPYSYSSHCGPAFYCDTSHGGRIKGEEARISWLPSSASTHDIDAQGRQSIYAGWGGTSNSSPSAAAKFSALMQRYGNYLSEEQIFTALCHSVAQEKYSDLTTRLKAATAAGDLAGVTALNKEMDQYLTTNLPGRHNKHFFDPLTHGFGEITQAALEKADTLCQDLVLYTMHRPHAVCRPTTFRAELKLADHAKPDANGIYRYRITLPAEVNLNNVAVEGTLVTPDLDRETISLVANNIRIRIPVGTTNSLQEYGITSPDKSPFIGSTRGFTGSGTVREIEVESTLPLTDKVSLTCYNTLGKEDAVSHIGEIPAFVDILQAGRKPLSLRMARVIDPARIDPVSKPVSATFYPANMTEEQIQHELARLDEQNAPHLPPEEQENRTHLTAYWRRRETDPPPAVDYNGQML